MSSHPSFPMQLKVALVKVGPAVYTCLLLATTLDQWITKNLHEILMSQDGIGWRIWFYGMLSMFNSLVFPALVLVLVIVSQKPVNDVFKNTFIELEQVLIESLRVWGKSIAWGFLFLIPGMIKWLRYSMVPFIVIMDEAYRQGEKDALQTSDALSRGKLLNIFVVFFTFALFLPLFMTSFDEYKLVLKTPFSALILLLFETLFSITFVLLLMRIYLGLKAK